MLNSVVIFLIEPFLVWAVKACISVGQKITESIWRKGSVFPTIPVGEILLTNYSLLGLATCSCPLVSDRIPLFSRFGRFPAEFSKYLFAENPI